VLLKAVSEQNGVASRIIATSDEVDALVLDDEADVPALKGWRRKIFGDKALAIKHGRLGLAATKRGIVEFPITVSCWRRLAERVTSIPPDAEELCRRYLTAFDARHPGLLIGLYLVGSIALDDFHPPESDVDFVAVTPHPLDLTDVAEIHAGLSGDRPFFDGFYVTEAELRILPGNTSTGVVVIDGVPLPDNASERHAVTWLTLARHGLAVRGPAPDPSWIVADLAAVQGHSRGNLDSYWHGWIASHRALPAASFSAYDIAWSVLGISRLHALIADALILSKTGAGHYALAAFPQHRSIIEIALAIRSGRAEPAVSSPESFRATFAFLDDVVADARGR
jgi:hypothetical protein